MMPVRVPVMFSLNKVQSWRYHYFVDVATDHYKVFIYIYIIVLFSPVPVTKVLSTHTHRLEQFMQNI